MKKKITIINIVKQNLLLKILLKVLYKILNKNK